MSLQVKKKGKKKINQRLSFTQSINQQLNIQSQSNLHRSRTSIAKRKLQKKANLRIFEDSLDSIRHEQLDDGIASPLDDPYEAEEVVAEEGNFSEHSTKSIFAPDRAEDEKNLEAEDQDEEEAADCRSPSQKC